MTELEKRQAKWKHKEEADKIKQAEYLKNPRFAPILAWLQSQGFQYRFIDKGYEFELDLRQDNSGYWSRGKSPEECLVNVCLTQKKIRKSLSAEIIETVAKLLQTIRNPD